MLTNYHTHTSRCFHAFGEDEEYVRTAVESGYSILGFSDHTPWPYTSGYVSKSERMPVSQMEEYRQSVLSLKEKYKDEIKIRLGLECEYFPQFFGWLRDVSPQFDYLILGNHFELSDEHGEPYYGHASTKKQLISYTEHTIKGMESGMFAYLAHPEVVLADYPSFDKDVEECMNEICMAGQKNGMLFEYNMYGVIKKQRGVFKGLGYPYDRVWEIVSHYKIDAIIGVDAHRPEQLAEVENIRKAKEFLRSLNINVVEEWV